MCSHSWLELRSPTVLRHHFWKQHSHMLCSHLVYQEGVCTWACTLVGGWGWGYWLSSPITQRVVRSQLWCAGQFSDGICAHRKAAPFLSDISQCCLRNISDVDLIDEGSFSSLQGRQIQWRNSVQKPQLLEIKLVGIQVCIDLQVSDIACLMPGCSANSSAVNPLSSWSLL